MDAKNQKKIDVLVVGAGPAGLSCAITAKKEYPSRRVCVVDKSTVAGGHNLSGAALEPKPIDDLLNMTVKDWHNAPIVKDVLGSRITNNQIYMLSEQGHTKITSTFKIAKKLHLSTIDPFSNGHYIVSLSKLTRLLAYVANNLGVELMFGSAVEDIEYDAGCAVGVRLLDKSQDEQALNVRNSGEVIEANLIALAEGCDGFVTEKFVTRNGLSRKQPPIFSVGVKEIVEVSANQYNAFGQGSFLRFSGYPFWRPLRGPSILGTGIMYPAGTNRIAVTAVTALDWKYPNYSPQSALMLIKEHPFVSKFVMGGHVVEAGMKMIPQGGYNSIPTYPTNNGIGKNNVIILGDGASFFNVKQFKGIGNAITSGMSAGIAVGNIQNKMTFAHQYTDILKSNGLLSSIKRAANCRQLESKAGVGFGLAMSKISSFLPFKPAIADHKAMTTQLYPYEPNSPMVKASFVENAKASGTNGKNHLFIKDLDICKWDCMRTYDSPCLRLCPAGVFKKVMEHIQPATPEKCLQCKSCQRKCPYDNISWTMPQAGSGPQYHCS